MSVDVQQARRCPQAALFKHPHTHKPHTRAGAAGGCQGWNSDSCLCKTHRCHIPQALFFNTCVPHTCSCKLLLTHGYHLRWLRYQTAPAAPARHPQAPSPANFLQHPRACACNLSITQVPLKAKASNYGYNYNYKNLNAPPTGATPWKVFPTPVYMHMQPLDHAGTTEGQGITL